jgi:hypothetical protein
MCEDIVFVRNDDCEYLLEFIKEYNCNPHAIYVLKDTCDNKDIDSVLYFNATLLDIPLGSIEFLGYDKEALDFLKTWDLLSQTLKNCDYNLAVEQFSCFNRYQSRVYDKSSIIKHFTCDYIALYYKSLFVCSPVGLKSYSTYGHGWFAYDIDAVGILKNCINKFIGMLEANFLKHTEIYKFLGGLVCKINGISLSAVHEKLMFFSSYMFLMAKYYKVNNELSISLLCLYRSLDFYFQSLAYDNGLLVISNQKICFPKSQQYVTLANVKNELAKNSIIAFSQKESSFLNEVNNIRILMKFIHGVHSVSQYDVLNLTRRTYELIKNNNNWKNYYSLLNDSLFFSRRLLIDCHPEINSYFSEYK